MRTATFVVITVGIVLGLVAGLLILVRGWQYSIIETQCSAYAQATSRQTKFVEMGYWVQDCLTPSSDGKWISIDNLREVTR